MSIAPAEAIFECTCRRNSVADARLEERLPLASPQNANKMYHVDTNTIDHCINEFDTEFFVIRASRNA